MYFLSVSLKVFRRKVFLSLALLEAVEVFVTLKSSDLPVKLIPNRETDKQTNMLTDKQTYKDRQREVIRHGDRNKNSKQTVRATQLSKIHSKHSTCTIKHIDRRTCDIQNSVKDKGTKRKGAKFKIPIF